MAIGSAVATAILVSGPITSAGADPARAIGPMILAGRFTHWRDYLAAPIVGGILAATIPKVRSCARGQRSRPTAPRSNLAPCDDAPTAPATATTHGQISHSGAAFMPYRPTSSGIQIGGYGS